MLKYLTIVSIAIGNAELLACDQKFADEPIGFQRQCQVTKITGVSNQPEKFTGQVLNSNLP